MKDWANVPEATPEQSSSSESEAGTLAEDESLVALRDKLNQGE